MIKEDIQKEIFKSLKEGKKIELMVLRFLLSIIQYEEIAKQNKLTDEEIISVFQKEIKKRQEAIVLFEKGKRSDLVDDEKKQLAIIERYLPKKLSNEELNQIIDFTVNSSTDKSNIGKLIGQVVTKVDGRAEGFKVAQLVRQKISSLLK